MKRILFVPEASILAHVGRTLAVAREMAKGAIEVRFAASGRHSRWIDQAGFARDEIFTRRHEDLIGVLRRGSSAFDSATLREYVRCEMDVLKRLKPDAVVGDFRPSLSISAKVCGTPYVSLTNVVWTRYAAFQLDPPRSWWATRILGPWMLKKCRALVERRVFSWYARPFNAVRKEHGLPPQDDVRDCMCSEDLTLLPDLDLLFPTKDLPPHFRNVGPIFWEPDIPKPAWWDRFRRMRGMKKVYVTMGSTGPADQIRAITQFLLQRPDVVVVCTTSPEKACPLQEEERCFLHPYLPGREVCAASDLVVCHAGNGTIYQALSQGKPLVGLAEFHDQEFNMQRVEAAGMGLGAANAVEAAEKAARILEDYGRFARAAEKVGRTIGGEQPGASRAAQRIAECVGARLSAANAES